MGQLCLSLYFVLETVKHTPIHDLSFTFLNKYVLESKVMFKIQINPRDTPPPQHSKRAELPMRWWSVGRAARARILSGSNPVPFMTSPRNDL